DLRGDGRTEDGREGPAKSNQRARRSLSSRATAGSLTRTGQRRHFGPLIFGRARPGRPVGTSRVLRGSHEAVLAAAAEVSLAGAPEASLAGASQALLAGAPQAPLAGAAQAILAGAAQASFAGAAPHALARSQEGQ